MPPTPAKLFNVTEIEPKDKFEEDLERCHSEISAITSGLSKTEAHDALTKHIGASTEQHEDVCNYFFYIILTEPNAAGDAYRDLTILSRDHLNGVMARLNQMLVDKMTKMTDACLNQVLWFSARLMRDACLGADTVCLFLMKNIQGGDLSHRNVRLTERVLDIFIDNRKWLDNDPVLLGLVVYTYIRLIVDHRDKRFEALRQKEVTFCISLLREKFMDCCGIGRDLLRLLQDVAHIPEFSALWKDMLFNPSVLSPKFTGIHQILSQRTQRKFISCRVTPEMENKINFLLSKVRFGLQKKYQEWFQKTYLSTVESQSLCADLIRYICAVIHPSNEILCSDICPRWAVIGWLLMQCKSNIAATNCKLALFYDWLMYQPEKDSIMNIEPAILVMYHNLKHHVAMTATLLDFLCRVQINFYPLLEPQIRQGISSSFRAILEKRVLPSLIPLLESNKLDRDLRALLTANFSEFMSKPEAIAAPPLPPQPPLPPTPPPTTVPEEILDLTEDDSGLEHDTLNGTDEPEFSDDDEIIQIKKNSGHVAQSLVTYPNVPDPQPENISDYLEVLDEDMVEMLKDLEKAEDDKERCSLVNSIGKHILRTERFEHAAPAAACLCSILHTNFIRHFMPDYSSESIQTALSRPLYVLFTLMTDPRHFSDNQSLSNVVAEMYERIPRIGYHLLLFLNFSTESYIRGSIYGDLAMSLELEISALLVKDAELCAQDDVWLLVHLLPVFYVEFKDDIMGNTKLLSLLLSVIDPFQLQHIASKIMMDEYQLLESECLQSVLEASFEWESFAQYGLWHLVNMHEFDVNEIIPIIRVLKNDHVEAATMLMQRVKKEKLTQEVVRIMYSCEPDFSPSTHHKADSFVTCTLYFFAMTSSQKLADITRTLLCKSNSTPTKPKRKSGGRDSSYPSIQNILRHLKQLYQRVDLKSNDFFSHDSLLDGLQHAYTLAFESERTEFSELFKLINDAGDSTSRRSRSKRSGLSSPISAAYHDSDDSDSEIKILSKRRRKLSSSSDTESD